MIETIFDTETFRFAPGHGAPKLVCASFVSDDDAIGLVDHREAVRAVGGWLLEKRVIVGHNLAYDFVVLCREEPGLLPHVFQAYAENRIRDTQIEAKLLAIARGDFTFLQRTNGGFTLAGCALREAGIALEKGAERTDFARFRGVPIAQWPHEYVTYSKSDAGATKALRGALVEQGRTFEAEIGVNPLDSELVHVQAAFALKLASTWGMRTNPERTKALYAKFLAAKAAFDDRMRQLGVLRANGSKDMSVLAELVSAAYNGEPPRTDSGKVSTAKQTLIESGDPDLMGLAGFEEDGAGNDDFALQRSATKWLSTYFPAMLHGMQYPITPGFQDIVETGRSACRKPNLQNWPTKMDARTPFEPRPGWDYIGADYSGIDLCTFAQAALDLGCESAMADALRQGLDLHVMLGASFAHTTYDELLARYKANEPAATRWRKLAKGPNFGLPGMLGPGGLIAYCKNMFQITLERDESENYCERWKETYPEHAPMFDWVLERTGRAYGSRGLIIVPRINHVRGGCIATEGANSLFQPGEAYGAKAGVFETSRRMYTVPKSALYGSRLVNFIHDEQLAESPKGRSKDALAEMESVMISEMRRVACPDIPVKTEGYVSERWE